MSAIFDTQDMQYALANDLITNVVTSAYKIGQNEIFNKTIEMDESQIMVDFVKDFATPEEKRKIFVACFTERE